jgi:hypothetical protein
VLEIMGEEDCGHAPAPDLFFKSVTGGEYLAQQSLRKAHVGRGGIPT